MLKLIISEKLQRNGAEMNKLTIAGGGSGNSEYMLPVTAEKIKNSDYIIAGKRFAEFVDRKKFYPFSSIENTVKLIKQLLEKGSVTVIVSGDPLMYSFCRTFKNCEPDIPFEIIPSVGSLQTAGAKFGITMENAVIMSVHGRYISPEKILDAAVRNECVFFLCSAENNPSYIADILLENDVDNVEICVGANLTYPDEVTDRGKPSDISGKSYPPLCVAIVKNSSPSVRYDKFLLDDSDFIRNSSPMTKEEIRAVILMKMKLRSDMTVWDIGAGTGSISVECARFCNHGTVYSVEKNKQAVEILEKNKKKFSLYNMKITEGNAAEKISLLPVPDTVFIGGSDGELRQILEYICSLEQTVHIVMTAVTLETFSEAYELMKDMAEFGMVQISANSARKLGRYRIMNAANPVSVISCLNRYTEE